MVLMVKIWLLDILAVIAQLMPGTMKLANTTTIIQVSVKQPVTLPNWYGKIPPRSDVLKSPVTTNGDNTPFVSTPIPEEMLLEPTAKPERATLKRTFSDQSAHK